MGLNIVPGRYAFYLFKHFAEIKCAFKAQTVSNLIDFIILFQKKNLGPAYFFLGNVFRKSDAAAFLKKGA